MKYLVIRNWKQEIEQKYLMENINSIDFDYEIKIIRILFNDKNTASFNSVDWYIYFSD